MQKQENYGTTAGPVSVTGYRLINGNYIKSAKFFLSGKTINLNSGHASKTL